MTGPGAVRRPVPSRCYTQAVLDAFAAGGTESFVAGRGGPLRPRHARSLALARLRPGLEIADIGCGRGEAAVRAAMRGANVRAVDYSTDAIATTRATASGVLGKRERGRLVSILADATALPLGDESVDRVLMLDVVEHLLPYQAASALGEAARILRDDGYVIIHTLPNRWALALGYPMLALLVPGLPRRPRSDYEEVVHVNEQSPASLAAALRRAGLVARVWVEEWTTRQARWARGRAFPDAARAAGYPVLRGRAARTVGRIAMGTPARWFAGNDIFALAWREGDRCPTAVRRLARVR